SCATVQYILGDQKAKLTTADTKIDDPYNTYRNDGLPPGPIAVPGLKALEAALYPEENDYYFFLAKPDGYHYFSKTLDEHNAAKAKYLN
ncbi:MAG: endolytic transglycosylase MltG, partial [Clostridia bacterium]|nr:endolytic transglycosylase MltG [Clostridia bacterium]